MLARAASALRRTDARLAVSMVVIAAACVYALVRADPFICVLILPFFALGCARGKHPMALVALALVPALGLLVASLVKFRLTGVPLVTYDHYFLRRNVLMLAYNDWRVAAGGLLGAAGIVAYLVFLMRGRGRFSVFEKAFMAVLAVVSIGCLRGYEDWDQDIFGVEGGLSEASLRTFVKSGYVPVPHLQVGQDAARMVTTPGGMTAPDVRPDLFFILEESTLHPAVLRPDYVPKALFAPRPGGTGPLHVNTFAGATWRTEFSIVTQMRPQEFGGDGLYVFHQLEGRIKRTILTELKALGYRTMVFYPVPGDFINARGFYVSIGADEFHDPVTLGISDGWQWHIADATFFSTMLKQIGDDPRPVAAVMLTINQHGPHDVADPIGDYLGRFADSDAGYAGFLDALAKRGRKAGVVAYGDHQPEFTARFIEDHARWYFTAYDIRCVNFECRDTPMMRRDGKPLDVVMLTATALEAFGFGLDDFSRLQRELFAACDDDITRCGEDARLKYNAAFSAYFE